MGVITTLEVQKRNKERVNVYLDGEYSFSTTLIDAARLRKGQTLTDAEIAALRVEDAIAKAVDSAVRFLAYRPRSVAEIQRNLAEKSIDELVITAAIDRLSTLGYLDDEAFARFWVDNRTAFKPLGPSALRYELRQKGIAEGIIEEILDQLDATASARQAASGQIRRLRGSDQRTFRQKLGSFLQRRGFGYDVISEVVSAWIEELEATDYFADQETADDDM
ncbi:MAG TPA: RecX family transcriptional regulator [Phototrophicaceae bacterium]|jgi:regulatory protein|nr:RecX family transcriptional regulator [Phototrophicaceae bacterium]